MQKIRRHLSKDPIFKKIIQTIDLPERTASGDVYFDLVRSIVGQQLSVKAASTIFGRFQALFPKGYPKPNRLLKLDVDQLRSVGLSYSKANYVQNVAAFFKKEKIKTEDLLEMSQEEVVQYLTQIKGVGPWTVEMILMFSLDHPDILPLSDLAIRNTMIELYEVKESGKALYHRLEEIAEPWRPYRTTACRYIWKWKDSGGI